MDRLLTPNEQPNIPQDAFSIYDWKTALQIERHINEVKKLQDSKTAHLVAQDILDELEEKCNCYPDFDFEDIKGACPRCRRNIRSKWGDRTKWAVLHFI